MPKPDSPPARTASSSLRFERSLAAPRPKAAGSLNRAVPASSLAKAKKAFSSFSLSRFAGDVLPSNHIAAGQNPAVVQRRIISQNIETLSKASAPSRAMTIALPAATIKQLLPSYDAKAGTVDLSDVMNLIQQSIRGTEFYSYGNPTLNSLAVQSQIQQIMASFKQPEPPAPKPSAASGKK